MQASFWIRFGIGVYYLSSLFLARSLSAQQGWKSIDGKRLDAHFVKIDGEDLVVRKPLEGRGTIKIPLSRLSDASRAEALYLQSELVQWAMKASQLPVLDEDTAQSLLEIAPSLMEGRSFAVTGKVGRIDTGTTLSPAKGPKVSFVLEGGLYGVADFSTFQMLEISDGSVYSMRRTKLGGGTKIRGPGDKKDYTRDKLILGKGYSIGVRATVKAGRLVGGDLIDAAEITKAQLTAAIQTGNKSANDLIEIETTRIRVKLLTEQLRTGVSGKSSAVLHTGTASIPLSLTHKFTPAELEAMKSELAVLEAKLAALVK